MNNDSRLGDFANAERTLLKLKISELENEIIDLKRENKHVY